MTKPSRKKGKSSAKPAENHAVQLGVSDESLLGVQVNCLAYGAHGKTLILGADDGTVIGWDVASGTKRFEISTPWGHVTSISADQSLGRFAAAGDKGGAFVWNSEGREIATFDARSGDHRTVAIHPNGSTLAVGTSTGSVALWDVVGEVKVNTLDRPSIEAERRSINSLAFSPDGERVAAVRQDGAVTIWTVRDARKIRLPQAGPATVYAVAFDPSGLILATAGSDRIVSLWDVVSGKCLRTLEGHTDIIDVIAFSPDGNLFGSKSNDKTIRLWRRDTWDVVSIINVPKPDVWIPALAFHPNEPILATAGPNKTSTEHRVGKAIGKTKRAIDRSLQLWRYDIDALLRAPLVHSTKYRNAKVVVVGDTGVGKSGLALRMAESRFEATESTHGRRVWTLQSSLSPEAGRRRQKEAREILLWDLAGQAAYRLVHQLSIDEAAVALVVVDARSETDPLGPAEYWAKAIAQARSVTRVRTFLVEARSDRGGVSVSRDDLARFCDHYGFDGFFSTSAKTGAGVKELVKAVKKAINWSDLPEVVSTDLFTKVRDYLKSQKEKGDSVLVENIETLRRRVVKHIGRAVTDAEFRSVIGRLEASSLASFLVFTALGENSERPESVLMQPEYIDAYASAIINQARRDPRGIGHVSEDDVRQGKLAIADTDRIPNQRAERLVIGETIEQLIRHDIALRERLEDGNYLVFPSQYTRTSPYPRSGAAGLAYEFEGACRSVFATLVVRLTYHRDFVDRDFWKDAARYHVANGGRCIVVLDELGASRGRLSVFFENDPPRTEQDAFLNYVFRHVSEKAVAGSVVAHRENRCPVCGHPWAEAVVESRLKLGKDDIVCPNCDTRSPLGDLLFDADPGRTQAESARIDLDAHVARHRELAIAAVRGKEQFGQYDVFLSYSTGDRDQVVEVAEMLRRVGLRPWLDVWDLVPGQPWQEALEHAISRVRSAAVFVGPSGIGPWQNREARSFIEEFVRREVPVIPVLLRGAADDASLPVFLRAFHVADLRQFSEVNAAPIADLVAGILGRPPKDVQLEALANQLSSAFQRRMPSAPSVPLPNIVLPVNRNALTEDELAAVVLQTAQVLGVSAKQVQLVRTEPGSVRVVLQLDDMIAVSQLFSMAARGDPTIVAFFSRCQIDADKFEAANPDVPDMLRTQQENAKSRARDDVDEKIAGVQKQTLIEWAGGAGAATVVIVFTDIVGSTKLQADLGDSQWDIVRQRHFARVQQLVRDNAGCFVKNTGDGVMAAFRSADAALAFGLGLRANSGHSVVNVRIGLHVGAVSILEDDAFGHNVNFAARVMATLENAGLIMSAATKHDLDTRRTPLYSSLNLRRVERVSLKGIEGEQTLWLLVSEGASGIRPEPSPPSSQ
jgi:small GTP-binding protein